MPEEDDDDVYSLDEVRALLAKLTDEEHSAINLAARFQAKALPARAGSHEDLMQEAYERVLDGRRKWKRKYSARQFFCGQFGVIRGIASELRKKALRQTAAEAASGSVDDVVPSDEELRIDVSELFPDDPIAKKIVRGMMGESVGDIDRELIEQKRRKIKNRIVRFFRGMGKWLVL